MEENREMVRFSIMITVTKNDKNTSSSFVHVNHLNLNKIRVIIITITKLSHLIGSQLP